MRTIIAAALAAALTASVPAFAQDDSPPPRTISVSGTASRTAANDTAGFTTGVDVRRSSAGEALRNASAAMRRIVAAVQGAGVAARDIRTQRVDVYRTTRRHGRVVLYVATSTASVVVRTIDDTGAVIDAAIGAGANRLSGPRFWRSSTRGLYREALVAALGKAREKAQALAADSGETLGQVLVINESGLDVDVYGESDSVAAVPQSSGAPTKVSPGRSIVRAQVTAVYAIG